MGYPAPFVGRTQQVEDQWIDYNGHCNMAYYNVLFDRAGDEAFAAVGLGPDYVKERNASFFTLESHNTYLAELHAGDSVRIETQFLDCDAKRVHYVQQMFHAKEGWLSCVTELIVMHVDMAANKKSAPFPPDVMYKIAAMREAHGHLSVPPQVGHKMGIPRKS
ncbi:MAG: thioesterase family protein [Alphaproteobacteria bacterium]|nr:thioesterase family protein [Alphaproteobacteria bacterium]